MPKRLPDAVENPVAAAIRKAIGASDTAPVAYSSRPRDRHPAWPAVQEAPKGFAEFTRLFDLTGEQLQQLGCGCWDGGLYLFPVEWYDHIPDGFPIEDINGDLEKFKRGASPKDPGFGMLAYGVRIGLATDEDD